MKPRLLLLSVVVMVTTLMIPAGGTAGPTANARFRTVTKTFVNPTAITIAESGAASPYPSIIRVSGFRQGTLLDVNLTLHGFEHTWPDDVDVLLVAPGGRNAIVMSDAGHNFPVSGITVTLDDEATRSLPDEAKLITRAYRPANYSTSEAFPPPAPSSSSNVKLATFDGINPNGDWKLFVIDVGAPDAGSIANGWQVTITARVRR